MKKRKNITKLPVVLQTDTLKKFFSSTVDQLFFERNSEKLDGFVGRRVGGCYDVNSDFYIGEITKNRTNYQLEPCALTKNPDTFEDENIVLYQDLLNKLRFYGANISEHDRLFETPYYSFSPPIDVDKFLNYFHYVWVADLDNIPPINIRGLPEATINTEIIGQTSFNTKAKLTVDVVGGVVTAANIEWPGEFYSDDTGIQLILENTAGGGNGDAVLQYNVVDGQITNLTIVDGGTGYTDGVGVEITETPDSVSLSSGFVILFPDAVSGSYQNIKYRVEGVGRGMHFVPQEEVILPFDQYVFIPWDFNGDFETGAGDPWDTLPWDCELGDPSLDYLTIERGACDKNGWSRSNSWYHVDVINQISDLTGQEIADRELAKRPIIEFRRDIELYRSGLKFLNTVTAVAKDLDPLSGTPETYNDLFGDNVLTGGGSVDLKLLEQGDLIIFAHPMTRAQITINISGGQLTDATLVSGGDSYLPNVTNAVMFLNETAGGGGGDASLFYSTNSNGEVSSVSVRTFGTGYEDGTNVAVEDDDIPYPTTGQAIYQASVDPSTGIISFSEFEMSQKDDVVFALEGEERSGESYYNDGEKWVVSQTQKTGKNVPPLFQLYDCDGVELDNEVVYPRNNFSGSEIFSYKINNNSTRRDRELGFPLEFSGLGQISDIVFENDLQTDRASYVVGNTAIEIPGYYFYNILKPDSNCNFDPELTNEWKFFNNSKQRVIDRYVITDVNNRVFDLSVLPFENDVIVKLDGIVLDINVDFELNNDKVTLLRTPIADQVIEILTYTRQASTEQFTVQNVTDKIYKLAKNPDYPQDVVVSGSSTGTITDFDIRNRALAIGNSVSLILGEIITVEYVSSDNLTEDARGYYEIPQSLENNPENQELTEHSYNDLAGHFVSIVTNQPSIGNVQLGEKNTYRDSEKDTSRGELILQNESSLLKAMFGMSNDNVDIVKAIRFAKNEYTRFRNKFLQVVYNMNRNNEFASIPSLDNTIELDAWFNEAIKRTTTALGLNTTFKNSYMIALGTVYQEDSLDLTTGINDGSDNITVELTGFDDLTDLKNILYVFSKRRNASPLTGQKVLTEGVDYEVISTDAPIRLQIKEGVVRQTLGTRNEIDTVSLSSAGSAYAIGDQLTVTGGTGASAVLRVVNIDIGGVITEIEILNGGEYVINPPSPVTVTGGGGSGATFNVTYKPRIRIDELYARIYSDPSPVAHIPATPSKLGMYQVSVPRQIVDGTFPTPQSASGSGFILGHDGSKTPILGDVRDQFLLEFERRIYNGIPKEFKNDYQPSVAYEDVWPGKFRDTNYTYEEVNNILKSSFSKWTSNFRKNWRTHDTYDPSNEWTYNYRGYGVNESNTPGNWRGIYHFYFDTDVPHTAPWEMLGFDGRPSWWLLEYSGDYSSNNTAMWNDIENGFIRQGPRQGFDARYARPGLVAGFLPVDSNGDLIPPTILGLADFPVLEQESSGDWQFGDYAPIEKEWRDSSTYRFDLMEFFYLTKPAKFAERFWDTRETTTSLADPEQIVNTETCLRSKPSDLRVHGEVIGGKTIIKSGYQQWVSDRLSFLNLNITSTLGERIRTLRTKLAHKMAGFTVEDTFKLFSESISPESSTNTLLLPQESIDIQLQKGPSIDDYAYSGVIIRQNEEEKFQIYGYDLLTCTFKTHPRIPNGRLFEITVGGTQVNFREFLAERSYKNGEYVRYNTVFYRANRDVFADRFNEEDWTKVDKLPTSGGVEATYYPDRNLKQTDEYLYGHQFDTVQEVFDFLIGYESYLKNRGWIFEEVNPKTNVVSDFLEAGKQFMSWVSMNFDDENVITVSPLAAGPRLKVQRGYADSVERTNNGVYSLLDEQGVVIDPRMTAVLREDQEIKVIPLAEDVRVYYMRVSASETEHVITVDNITTFNDVIFDPLMGVRQPRLRLSAVRTKDWTGKFEAPGYIINDQLKLVPNIENTTQSIRRYHDTETALDLERVENTARHLIGYEEKDYLVNLELDEDVQYQFYQGAIREKGTEESIKKLLRSSYVTSEQDIVTYEEWALKIADFGAICENQSFDISIRPSELKTEPQLIVLDTPQTRTGSIKKIIVINSVDTYETPPTIRIERGPGDFGNGGGAIASAVLDDAGFLVRIDVIEPGCGYITEPVVYITDGAWDIDAWDIMPWDYGTNDKALAVLQKDIRADRENDDIIYVDVDDPERWVRKPRTCGLTNLFPTTNEIEFEIPNAGWASLNDVDNALFDINNFVSIWENNSVETPIIEQTARYNEATDEVIWTDGKRQTIYIAKARLGSTEFADDTDIRSDDWNIYRATYADMEYGESFLIENNPEGAVIEVDFPGLIPTDIEDRRYIGSVIVVNVRKTIQKKPLRTEIKNYAFYLEEIPDSEGETFVRRFRLNNSNRETVDIDQDLIDNLTNNPLYEASLWIYTGMRFDSISQRDNFSTDVVLGSGALQEGEYTWINNNADGLWEVQVLEDGEWNTLIVTNEVNDRIISTPRIEGPQVDSNLFKNAFLYGLDDQETIFMLPVYDPYKGILPGPADQNIDLISEVDPARYSYASNEVLVEESIKFNGRQEGILWWDTSTMRYINYEQGTNRERRNLWGKLFPGSVINIYEWTRSLVPPSEYEGEGVVRNTTDYAVFNEYDPFLERDLLVYYFWVKDKITVPKNIKNRTRSSKSIAALLQNPNSRNYRWFAPVNYHSNFDSFERHRASWAIPVQDFAIITDDGASEATRFGFTIPYPYFENLEVRIRPGAGNIASPFENNDLLIEGIHYTVNKNVITYNPDLVFPNTAIDIGDIITIDYKVWTEVDDRNSVVIANVNKTLSSKESVLQINYSYLDKDSNEHSEWHLVREGDENSTILDQHWNKMVDSLLGQTDIIKWSADVPGFCPTSATEGFLLVPDPSLNDAEKCGTSYRPRQTWFADMTQARKIFVKKINQLLGEICIRDLIPEWEEKFGSDGSTIWEWVNWYAEGWNAQNAIPTRQVRTVTQLEQLKGIVDQEIIKVLDPVDPSALFTLYVYNANEKRYDVIARQNCTVELQSIIFEEAPPRTERTFELRKIIKFIETDVFVVDNLIKKNTIFFTMLNYSISEKKNNDWAFKTTYLVINQSGIELEQRKFLGLEPEESIVAYVNSVKPYHCKVRDFSTTRSAGNEFAPGSAEELVKPTITINFDRVACNTAGTFRRGTGYQVGDILTAVGGDFTTPLTARVIEVLYEGDIYRSPIDEFGNDVFGVIQDIVVVDGGNYATLPTEPVMTTGGSGTGAMLRLAEVDCRSKEISRDARSFLIPTYPWDVPAWDECPWDGEMETVYYTASNPSNPVSSQFDQIPPEWSVPSDNFVTNGTFDADSDWTKGLGWSIAAGVASCDGTQIGNSDLSQGIPIIEGNTYEVTYTVSGYVSGNVTAVVGDTEGTDRSGDGTYTETIVAGPGTDIDIRGDLTFVGNIDNVEVINVAAQEIYLPFSPTVNAIDAGPYVFINGEQNFNFNYNQTENKIVFFEAQDVPSPTDEVAIRNIMPFEGGGFLQPYVAENIPEELVPLNVNENLVINVTRTGYRCSARIGPGTIYWLPDSDVNTSSLSILVDGTPLDPSDFDFIGPHYWDASYNVVTNGEFSVDADWDKGADWSIAGGLASCVPGGSGPDRVISQSSLPLAPSTQYKVSFFAQIDTGSLTVSLGGNQQTVSTDDTYELILTTGLTDPILTFTGDASFEGDIDDVIVSRVADYPWDPTSSCAGPLWDAEEGIIIYESFAGGEDLTFLYELNSGATASGFRFIYHMNPAGWQEIYRVCSNETATLLNPLTTNDNEITLTVPALPEFEGASLRLPRYIWIGGELIAYHEYDDSGPNVILRNLVRGINGTSPKTTYEAGTTAIAAKDANKLPDINNYSLGTRETNDFTEAQISFLTNC